MTLTVSPITHKIRIRDWLAVPHIVYAGDPAFVPQLDFLEAQRISPGHAPFFKFGEAAFFVAYQGGKPAGRISAQLNHRYLELYNDATGHFGFFDCINDQSVADALIAAAQDWLKQKGMRRMMGPFSFSANEECGCLVNGFGTPPAMLMPNGAPWMGGLLEKAGMAKEMDLFTYRTKPVVPPRIDMLAKRAERQSNIKLRYFDMRRYNQEIELLVEIFNDAWSGNWGFVPFSQAEIDALAAELKPFFRDEYGRFLMVDGKAAGVIVLLPNLNEIIAKFGGKLLPFNWAKLVWALKRETWKTLRVPLMGIRRSFHASPQAGGLLALMTRSAVLQGQGVGLEWAEYGWVLEINKPMMDFGRLLAGPPDKTYRIFSKAL